MKYLICAALVSGFAVAPLSSHANINGAVEEIQVKLDERKLDRSVPAEERLEMFKRLADRKCDSTQKSLEARRYEEACRIEFKRSLLNQVGDEALKEEAEREGIL